jgi:hypothetical protein
MTPQVRSTLETRWESTAKAVQGWIWDAPTRSGHVEPSSLKKQHAQAFKVLSEEAAKNNERAVRPFVLYSVRAADFRHYLTISCARPLDIHWIAADRHWRRLNRWKA